MPSLADQHIVLGITGGIAAYKSAELARRLMDHGATVQVVMTDAAKAFIAPLTLQALSGRPVRDTLLDPSAESGMGHIEIARWADRLIVAPASADFIARIAGGMASDLLAAVCLATSAPVILAPAMNQGMWRKAATQRNIATLKADGVTILGPASGEQACGDVGPGRMLEPGDIISHLTHSAQTKALDGANVTITAGPTWEALDPVRGLSNHSSGKMGYAVAAAAAAAGAAVTLVSGPTALDPPPGIQYRPVRSAEEMLAAVEQDIEACDVFIGVAAVADYRPAQSENSKIKKHAESVTLELARNPDMLARVAQQQKRPPDLTQGPPGAGRSDRTRRSKSHGRRRGREARGQQVLAPERRLGRRDDEVPPRSESIDSGPARRRRRDGEELLVTRSRPPGVVRPEALRRK